MNDFNFNINKFVHKYGFAIHSIIFLYILYIANIHPNSILYYVFILNVIMIVYFAVVHGIAFGITKTAELMDEKTKEDERNKLN